MGFCDILSRARAELKKGVDCCSIKLHALFKHPHVIYFLGKHNWLINQGGSTFNIIDLTSEQVIVYVVQLKKITSCLIPCNTIALFLH